VKHFSSQRQGRQEPFAMLEPEEAHGWLLRNGREDVVPETFLAAQEV
jgi:hypothetical protein